MIGAILSLIVVAACVVISTAGMLLSGYLKYTSYANALILNGVWFLFYRFGGDIFTTWYPHVMNTDGKNFFVMCGILITVVLVINRFPKIRVAYYVSSSVAVGIIVAAVILIFKEEKPTVGYAVFLGIFSLVTIVLQLGAAERRGIDDSGNVVSRAVAAIFLMPAPILVSMIVIDTIWRPDLKMEALFALGVAAIAGVIYFVADTIGEQIPRNMGKVEIEGKRITENS